MAQPSSSASTRASTAWLAGSVRARQASHSKITRADISVLAHNGARLRGPRHAETTNRPSPLSVGVAFAVARSSQTLRALNGLRLSAGAVRFLQERYRSVVAGPLTSWEGVAWPDRAGLRNVETHCEISRRVGQLSPPHR